MKITLHFEMMRKLVALKALNPFEIAFLLPEYTKILKRKSNKFALT